MQKVGSLFRFVADMHDQFYPNILVLLQPDCGNWHGRPNTSEATFKNLGKSMTWIHGSKTTTQIIAQQSGLHILCEADPRNQM